MLKTKRKTNFRNSMYVPKDMNFNQEIASIEPNKR